MALLEKLKWFWAHVNCENIECEKCKINKECEKWVKK